MLSGYRLVMAIAAPLGGLDEDQRRAVECPTDPLCVVAPAGSGKTRVLVGRIVARAARGDLDTRRTLAITFTTKAARELQARLGQQLGRDVPISGTFHAIAYRMLSDHCEDRNRRVPVLLEDPGRLVADLWRGSGAAPLSFLRTEIAWSRARGLAPESYEDAARRAGRSGPLPLDRVAGLLADYAGEKRRRGVVDFDDLIAECSRLLEDDPGFAHAQRWRLRHFFVDEYQDVNPLQQRFLEALLASRDDLCVVGDANQAIYGFNGADARFLVDFPQRHPGATVIELRRNHRSSAAIVRVAEAVLGRPAPPGPLPGFDPPTVTACADAGAEALAIARRVRAEHLPGTRWRSQAILVRTRAQTEQIAALLERTGIPVRLQGEERSRDAVDLLSFHSAKGLEWPTVHLAGLEEGSMPDIHARTPMAIAEERRLLYVATTRAGRQLHCTWARRREIAGRTFERVPSRWLADIEVGDRGTCRSKRAPAP